MNFFSCSFLTSRHLFPYIFHSWPCPFLNHHFCDSPKPTCHRMETQRFTHFFKIRFSLSQEKFFSSTLSLLKTRDDRLTLGPVMRACETLGRGWASCLSSSDFPLKVLKIIGSVLVLKLKVKHTSLPSTDLLNRSLDTEL